MNLIERLRILKRATADRALIQALQYICISESRMQATDGNITIDMACPELDGMTFMVPGSKFVKAIEACDGSPDKIEIEGQSLLVKKGRFKAKIPLYDGMFPRSEFNSKAPRIEIEQGFIEHLRAIAPFVGEDASRPWCCGVLFKEGKAYATNNTAIVAGDSGLPSSHETFNLPSFAATEMLGYGVDPKTCLITEVSVTFEYDDYYFRTKLLPSNWPDFQKMLPETIEGGTAISKDLLDALEKVVAFCPDPDFQTIVFKGDSLSTADGSSCAEVSGFALPEGRYRAVVLQKVLEHALVADFSKYPGSIPFTTTSGLKGVFVGVRQ